MIPAKREAREPGPINPCVGNLIGRVGYMSPDRASGASGMTTWEILRRKEIMSASDARTEPDQHLIHVEDEEIVIEHHPEDWIAFVLFWALAFIVFLQFFTRYVLNDSLAWTEEIARYGLMSLAFIGGAVVTRKKAHIAVELVTNLMDPGPVRAALLALVDFITLGFLALMAYFSVTIVERMHSQPMTVFDLPMSLVYGLVDLGCVMMLARHIQVVWNNERD